MAKRAPVTDVIVMGEHPCAYLCAALLRQKGGIEVLHVTIPHESPPERLVTINPEFFDLHKLLEPLKKQLKLTPVWGLQFLGDDAAHVSEPHRDRTPSAFVACYRDVRSAMEKLAGAEGVRCVKPKTLDVAQADESGVDVMVGGEKVRAPVVALAGALPEPSRRVLGVPDGWPGGVARRSTSTANSRGRGCFQATAKCSSPSSDRPAARTAWRARRSCATGRASSTATGSSSPPTCPPMTR